MEETQPLAGSIRNLIKELKSMRKSKEKVAHSKFLPEENQFVNLQGNYWDKDNWEVNLTINGGSRDQVYLWVTDYDKGTNTFLDEVAKAVAKAQDAVAKFRDRAKAETAADKIVPKKKK